MSFRSLLFILGTCLLILIGCLISCESESENSTDDPTSAKLEVEVFKAPYNNPLAAKLEILSDISCTLSGYVTTNGEDGQSVSDPLSTSNGKTHTLWFYGLLPDTIFQYSVYAAGNKDRILATGSFKTDELPEWVQSPEILENVKTEADRSTWIAMTINTATFQEEMVNIIAVIDRQGRYRYFLQSNPYPKEKGQFLEGLIILSTGDFAWNNRSDIITANYRGEEGLLFDVLITPPFLESSHHQCYIFEDKGPTAWVLFNRRAPGLECDLVTLTQDTVSDGVAMLDENGKQVNRWEVLDSVSDIPPEDMNMCGCDPTIPQIDPRDFTHANSVWPMDNDEAFIISLRNLNRIVKVDVQSGEVQWQLGKGLDFTWIGNEDEENRWFSLQHDAHWLDDGHLLLFDNHFAHVNPCGPSPWSRALELDVDEATKTVSLVWEHRVPHAHANGNAQRMANGNTLISAGAAKQIFEVTPKGVEIWAVKYTEALNNLSTAKTMPALWEYGD